MSIFLHFQDGMVHLLFLQKDSLRSESVNIVINVITKNHMRRPEPESAKKHHK